MNNNATQSTFYFHDYETFGLNPAFDRPAQFAGIRTDCNFNIIEEPMVIYCKPSDDYLPDPDAVMITGITPQLAKKNGISEATFSAQIHHAFSQPDTCILGYNNIRFDDEVSRNIFYRNFYDPYAYSWQQGNSRWDMIDVVRACYALRPDGVNWPTNELGLPSFRLEHLTKANNIEHTQAHDAMSDVYATIAIAKLIKQAQPKLFDYLYQLRNKQKVVKLIDITNMTPLVHISGMFGAKRTNTSIVAPLAWHPDNKNAVIMCDLTRDLSPLLELDVDKLRERLYTRKDELSDKELPVPIKLVHSNKCPVLAPVNTLLPETAERLLIDQQFCINNLQILQQHPEIREKVVAIFAEAEAYTLATDVDGQVYNGFFSKADKAAMTIIQASQPKNLPALELMFNDKRLDELFFRYRARNYPETLNDQEQRRWFKHRQEKLNPKLLENYFFKLNELFELHQNDEDKMKIIKSLYEYATQI